jgi:hypothetical protein
MRPIGICALVLALSSLQAACPAADPAAPAELAAPVPVAPARANADAEPRAPGGAYAVNKACPVDGRPVDKKAGLVDVHSDKRVFFIGSCCTACGDTIRADPAGYLPAARADQVRIRDGSAPAATALSLR